MSVNKSKGKPASVSVGSEAGFAIRGGWLFWYENRLKLSAVTRYNRQSCNVYILAGLDSFWISPSDQGSGFESGAKRLMSALDDYFANKAVIPSQPKSD